MYKPEWLIQDNINSLFLSLGYLRVAKERRRQKEHEGDERNPTEWINVEVITNQAAKGDVFLYSSACPAPQSQEKKLQRLHLPVMAKSCGTSLPSLLSLKLEVSLLHFPYQSSPNFTWFETHLKVTPWVNLRFVLDRNTDALRGGVR